MPFVWRWCCLARAKCLQSLKVMIQTSKKEWLGSFSLSLSLSPSVYPGATKVSGYVRLSCLPLAFELSPHVWHVKPWQQHLLARFACNGWLGGFAAVIPEKWWANRSPKIRNGTTVNPVYSRMARLSQDLGGIAMSCCCCGFLAWEPRSHRPRETAA